MQHLLVVICSAVFTLHREGFIINAHAEHDTNHSVNPQLYPYPPGDVRNCPTTSPVFPGEPLYRMEVLPGAGFDSLRDLDMGQVHAYNYSQCRVSNDGHYLLPDSVFLIPTMKSRVETFAEFIDHWEDYKSTTSRSINVQAAFESIISGKFSDEYLSVKSHQYNDQAKTTRVQIRHSLFRVKIQPDSQLHPTFRSRLFEIAANIQNNNTAFAHYLAELVVRDYGTHYITTMEAGAVLSQVDHVKLYESTDSEQTKKAIAASASGNFFGKFSFGASFSTSTSESDKSGFINNRTYSEVYSWGGPPLRPNFTVDDWEKGIPNSLVAIDHSGDPLHFVITPTILPEMPEGTVQEVANMVSRVITRYYRINTHHGCTDPTATNFDFQANVNDNSCEPQNTNFTFGGIYQTCEYTDDRYQDLCNAGPEPVMQSNPLTGTTSCRAPYMPVLLHSGQYSHTIRKQECREHCGLFGWSCHENCALVPHPSMVNYKAYWCATLETVDQNSGYLFGGYYTSTMANPFTGTKTCPRYFIPLHFGEDINICVSNDYELGYPYSIPFAGFESCISGNPLAVTNKTGVTEASWPHACPYGYSQHLVAVDEACEINFCIKAGVFNKFTPLPPRLPPFRRKHKRVNPNTTDTMVVMGVSGKIWYRDDNGDWVRGDNSNLQSGQMLMALMQGGSAPEPTVSSTGRSSTSLSNGNAIAISVVVTVALCTLIVVLIFAGLVVKKKKSSTRKKKEDTCAYYNVSDDSPPPP